MGEGESKVPAFEWPEPVGLKNGAALVEQLMAILQEELGSDRLLANHWFCLVPDPPPAGASLNEIARQCSAAGEELDLASVRWGMRGLGFATADAHLFRRLIPIFFVMRSNELALIAARGELPAHREANDLSHFIEAVMTDSEGARDFVALFFDWGELQRIVRQP